MSLTIGAMFVALLTWSWFGKVDVIVTGQGKIIPSGHVKTVQPLEGGVVTAILVSEGQQVEKDQILIELDPTDTASSVQSLRSQKDDALLDLAVANALLSDDPLGFDFGLGTLDPQKFSTAFSQVRDNHAQHQATLRELSAEVERLNSQRDSIEIEIQKINDTLPILEERFATGGTLLSRDAMRQDDRLSLQQSIVETRAARSNHHQSIHQLASSISAVEAQHQQTVARFLATHRAASREAQASLAAIDSQIQSETRRNQYRTLRAPVAGYVDQVTAHTIGGVINAGAPVMNIVPSDSQPTIEAFILNKDVGFVHVGDPAEIKLEAFPFTRYGVLDGEITAISNDAVNHEQLGLVYKVAAQIDTSPESLEEAGIAIGPGMNVTLEVLTEQRRIIDYFISPLLRYQDEAIRER